MKREPTGHIEKHRFTLTLPAGRTNDLVTDTMVHTIEEMKGSRYADIIIRKNGEDHRFQADWLRYVKVKREPRIVSLLDTIPRAIKLWSFRFKRSNDQAQPEAAATWEEQPPA